MAYRTTVHDTTQETPFFLMHGRDMRTPMDIDLGTWNTSIATPDVRDANQRTIVFENGTLVFLYEAERILA
jgi:hypothetical protein